jgi:hypothetical protein
MPNMFEVEIRLADNQVIFNEPNNFIRLKLLQSKLRNRVSLNHI